MWMSRGLFIHSFIQGHLGCFYVLAFLNRAAVDTHVQVFVQMYMFISLG